MSKDEQYCKDHFRNTVTRESDGSFIVKYPFKQNVDFCLGESKQIALKRFTNLEKRLNKNATLKEQYYARV